MLTDGVESIISGVRPWEFHIDALEIFMGEKPAEALANIDPAYVATAAGNNATVSGAVLNALSVNLSKSYWMLESEVTMAQWHAVIATQPSNWPAAPDTVGYANYTYNDVSNDPTVFITSKDAEDFINALNTKLVTTNAELPTEAEWEYACRIPNRDIASSSAAAQARGWSDQDMPFGYGMHLYDQSKFFYAEDVAKTRKITPANAFYGIFDLRYTFSYNLPSFMPATSAAIMPKSGTSHYIRGYANEEFNFPTKPGEDPGGLIHNAKQNAWGLLHMHGNVGEIVRDIWDGAAPHNISLSATGATDYFVDMSSGPSWKMQFHPVKGGSWMSGGSQCRAASRGRLLKHDLSKYPMMNSDGTLDATKPDPRCYTDTVGIRPIIYE
ncbi:MAG: SUMF1/EgtB/PvdO family nonheme iron enzyme [Planctomycetes bacterium]|nr:SUMF1/EgtB/PvdO family nonheme iron enzyme [Planctomycetota bacterium]